MSAEISIISAIDDQEYQDDLATWKFPHFGVVTNFSNLLNAPCQPTW